MPTFRLSRRITAALLALAGLGASAASAADNDAALLNALFQDHAVLQREHANPVWGQAKPGEALTVEFAGKSVKARADAQGRWEATLPALPAGGPYALKVSAADGRTQSISDLLVGDVWLCSGQSNMVLQVKRTLDSRAEIQNASNDRIRMLTVDNVSSPLPLTSIPAGDHWLKTTPENVVEFSAACYYYARELQKTEPVPMGLIVAAWGGSRIEPWMSARALRKVGGFDDSLDLLDLYNKDRAKAGEQWDRMWQAWWHARPGVSADNQPWSPAHVSHEGWKPAPLDKGAWQNWGVPELANFTGMLWYRTTVNLTKEQAAQATAIALGPINETDQTWVNGRWVGTGYGGDGRVYQLPAGVLHEGVNLIAINVLGTYKDDGLYGPAEQRVVRLADGSSVPVSNTWEYQVVPKSFGSPPSLPWHSTAGLTTLYNGMIAPLGSYGLRGMLWYQGESNTGDPARYQTLLEALRSDWRTRFGANLPMLIVQLAGYGAAPTHPVESGSAAVREAQRLAAADDAHSGLAVAVDIGERTDIHPANKQELGRRLARASRHVVYGEKLAPSGPVPASAVADGDAVTLRFKDVTDALVVYGADRPVGFELCGTAAGSCHYAEADIHGDSVVLRAALPASAIARVRYCWADSPVCTLYDNSGLPAGPFEIPVTSSRTSQVSHP
ncbi:9-O-acetylesterase [Dyella solisilvae]|uniref:9-O-acetylesterase n=1 Tax=Dyella solisilvae TaxID=1920168 RepID=A0A370K9D3_9GAMM|nr:sialate O-acetylesterase [Dyella solisilvae]RDI99256.1 9-O-acetylesterase [Dyella solisilvae]